jgi:hypothetical protein
MLVGVVEECRKSDAADEAAVAEAPAPPGYRDVQLFNGLVYAVLPSAAIWTCFVLLLLFAV